jgi:pantoate--beta-alanine ligase
MQIFKTLASWRLVRSQLPPKTNLGFVPTMGNLHLGHQSLLMRSKEDNELTAMSLFVNPTQFNQSDDFIHYPRTLEADLELMSAVGVDYCILPTEEELYADGYRYQLHENELGKKMEGAHRPGHFNGVLTIVMKLFQLIKPTRTYFGEKDYQQYLLIKGMAEAFFMDMAIIPCPTIRESSGLAYSSRNNRLSAEQKKIAEQFARIFHNQKELTLIKKALEDLGIELDYLEDYEHRRYAAVSIGGVRLIDNYSLEA